MSTMRLIFARHGNTFSAEETPVWVGGRTDLPLVTKGLEQAHHLAECLKHKQITLSSILAGPLQRTKKTATIVAETLGLEPSLIRIDGRLTEIDYGQWEAKSSEQIIAMGGKAELEAWDKDAIFPTTPGWSPSEASLAADTESLMKEAIAGTSLIVTSNGILRFFARQAINAKEILNLKVATGHVCVLERTPENEWIITLWNQPPHVLLT